MLSFGWSSGPLVGIDSSMYTLNSRFRDGTLLTCSFAFSYSIFNVHVGSRDMQDKFTLVFELTLALKLIDISSKSAAIIFIFE